MAQFYSIKQTMEILSISRATIQRKIRTGEIPSVRIGKRVLIPTEFLQQLSDKAFGKLPPVGK